MPCRAITGRSGRVWPGGRAIAHWAQASDRVYFALNPATTIASWDYAHAFYSFSTANFFPLRATSIYASSQTASGSFLRLFNTGTAPGTATITLRNPAGQVLGGFMYQEQARYELFVTLRNLFDRQLQLPEVANYTPTQVVNGGDRFNVLAGIRFRL